MWRLTVLPEANMINDVSNFWQIVEAKRRELGYDPDEIGRPTPSGGYVLLGRFLLDRRGVLWTYARPSELEHVAPTVPPCVLADEFFGELGVVYPDARTEFHTLAHLPRTFTLCEMCQRPWGVNQLHDVIAIPRTFMGRVSVLDGERKSVRDERQEMEKTWFMPDYRIVGVHRAGADLTSHDIDTMLVKPGDRLIVETSQMYHEACRANFIASNLRANFEHAFNQAGFRRVKASRRPNERGDVIHDGPWFDITTDANEEPIVVGWDKERIRVDWKRTSILRIVPTRSSMEDLRFVHSYEQLVTLLQKLRRQSAKPLH